MPNASACVSASAPGPRSRHGHAAENDGSGAGQPGSRTAPPAAGGVAHAGSDPRRATRGVDMDDTRTATRAETGLNRTAAGGPSMPGSSGHGPVSGPSPAQPEAARVRRTAPGGRRDRIRGRGEPPLPARGWPTRRHRTEIARCTTGSAPRKPLRTGTRPARTHGREDGPARPERRERDPLRRRAREGAGCRPG